MAITRRRRRLNSHINVVPFIDVVLVLLIVFMVAAPMMQTGQIKLPAVGQSTTVPTPPLQIQIETGTYQLVRPQSPPQKLALERLAEAVREYQQAQPELPVVISADKDVKYEEVVRVMDQLQRHQIKHIGLLVRTQSQRE